MCPQRHVFYSIIFERAGARLRWFALSLGIGLSGTTNVHKGGYSPLRSDGKSFVYGESLDAEVVHQEDASSADELA